jgi:hypothetical protein
LSETNQKESLPAMKKQQPLMSSTLPNTHHTSTAKNIQKRKRGQSKKGDKM